MLRKRKKGSELAFVYYNSQKTEIIFSVFLTKLREWYIIAETDRRSVCKKDIDSDLQE